MDEVVDITQKYQERCNRDKVLPTSFWNNKRAEAASTDKSRIEELSKK